MSIPDITRLSHAHVSVFIPELLTNATNILEIYPQECEVCLQLISEPQNHVPDGLLELHPTAIAMYQANAKQFARSRTVQHFLFCTRGRHGFHPTCAMNMIFAAKVASPPAVATCPSCRGRVSNDVESRLMMEYCEPIIDYIMASAANQATREQMTTFFDAWLSPTGKIVKDADHDQMTAFFNTWSLPPDNNVEDTEPVPDPVLDGESVPEIIPMVRRQRARGLDFP